MKYEVTLQINGKQFSKVEESDDGQIAVMKAISHISKEVGCEPNDIFVRSVTVVQ